MFGYGFGISDVRVTLGDTSEHDCLQKIYPVGQFIAMGFAGSVRIGFAMVETLTKLLQNEDESRAWDPTAVAAWWPNDAREIFARFPDAERAGQCHLMMVSTHPTENCGDAPWARSYVHVFKSPSFEPEPVPVHKVGAIGCGVAVTPCRQAVENLSNSRDRMFMLMQGEQGTSGGMGSMLGYDLTQVLKRTSPRGISSHLNYCWVYRGQIIIRTNDHTVSGRWTATEHGSGINQPHRDPISDSSIDDGSVMFAMPKLATSWNELTELLSASGAKADGCVARCLAEVSDPDSSPATESPLSATGVSPASLHHR
jgi:hypothetical protein